MDKIHKNFEETIESEGKINIPDYLDLTVPDTEELQKKISESEDISYISKEILQHATFDTTFKWPEKLPEGFDPEKLIEEGKNPGLGINEIHNDGITGKGVTVAIIDQKIDPNHVEFKDNLIANNEYDPKQEGISMHGPGVSSLLVGKKCGISPDAKLYYAEGTISDYSGYTKALEDIIEYNKNLDKKIKIVSVSKGYMDDPGLDEWIKTKEKARENGITIIDSQYFAENFLTGGGAKNNKGDFNDYDLPLFYKKETPEEFKIKFNSLDKKQKEVILEKFGSIENIISLKEEKSKKEIIVPSDYRTIASRQGSDVYRYGASGGWSWAIPYYSGIFVLALQINSELTNEEFLDIVKKTAVKNKKGLKVINPEGIIEEVKKMIEEEK